MAVTRPSCAVCGAPGALRASEFEAGWFACRHCGSPSPIAGAGTVAIEGPGARVVCLSRPGQARIEAREGNLMPHEALLTIAITPGFLLAGLLWLVGLVAPRMRAVLEPAANGLLLLSFLVAVAAMRTRQVLEIEGRGVRAFWQTFGRRFRERVGTRAVAISIARGLWLRDPADERFVEKCVADALAHTAEGSALAAEVPCPGCGAAVPTGTTAEGVTACGWCGSSLVHGGDALQLGPVRLPELPAAAASALPAPSRRLRKHDDPLFVLPTFASRHGSAGIAIALVFLAPFVAAPLVGVPLIWDEAGALLFTKVFVSLLCIALSIMLAAAVCLAFWSVHSVAVSRHAVGHELRMFGIRVRSETLPIARLVEIGCSLDEARVALRLRSPTRKIALDALQKPPSGARFLRAVLEALEPHLRATGRLETAAGDMAALYARTR